MFPGSQRGPVVDGAGAVVTFVEGAAGVELECGVAARLPGDANFPHGAGEVFTLVTVEILAFSAQLDRAGRLGACFPGGTTEQRQVGAVAQCSSLLVVMIGMTDFQQRTRGRTDAMEPDGVEHQA